MRQAENFLCEFIDRCVREVLRESGMGAFEKPKIYSTLTFPNGETKTFKTRAEYVKWKKQAEEERKQKEMEENGKNNKKGNKTNKDNGRFGTNTNLKDKGKEINPSQMYEKIQKLIKNAAPLESLFTFKEHSYRSYGLLAKEMMQPFEREYREFSMLYRKMRQRLKKIEEYGRKDEYATYDEARNFAYDVREMQVALINLCDAVRSRRKEYKQKYGETLAYNGRISKDNPNIKKELGFVDQLFSKSPKVIGATIDNLYNTAMEIANVADLGRNPLTYKV